MKALLFILIIILMIATGLKYFIEGYRGRSQKGTKLLSIVTLALILIEFYLLII